MKRDSPTPSEALLDPAWAYESNPGFYDEVLGVEKRVRPHWGELTGSLAALGHAGLTRRWQEGRRLIHDNGVTYNVYSDPQSTSRPWPLDPIPLVMEPAEWKAIEAGIIQRATLFNLILADLYGQQRLLARRAAAGRAGASRTRPFCGRAGGSSRREAFSCTPMQPIWRGRRTGSGGCWRIARRRLRAPDTHWKTGW